MKIVRSPAPMVVPEGGQVFSYGGSYFMRLDLDYVVGPAEPRAKYSKYNAVDLTSGGLISFDFNRNMPGHTDYNVFPDAAVHCHG